MEQRKGKMSAYLRQKRANKVQNSTQDFPNDAPINIFENSDFHQLVNKNKGDLDNKTTIADNSNLISNAVSSDMSVNIHNLHIHENRTEFVKQDLLVPWKLKPGNHYKNKQTPRSNSESDSDSTVPVYYRFYHVFREGELEDLIQQIPGLQIVKSYYDEGNWCVLLQKKMK